MKTLDELLQERKQLDIQIEQAKKNEIEAKREHVRAKIESFSDEQKQFLLSLMDHDRTSCSDNCVANGRWTAKDGGWRCRKCMLIEILNGTNGTDFDFDVTVDIYPVE